MRLAFRVWVGPMADMAKDGDLLLAAARRGSREALGQSWRPAGGICWRSPTVSSTRICRPRGGVGSGSGDIPGGAARFRTVSGVFAG